VYSVRPKFEHLNQDRVEDLGVGAGDGRMGLVAAALGLERASGGVFEEYVIPGGERFGFDIDDNDARDKTPLVDSLVVEMLRMQAPELLTGSDFYNVNGVLGPERMVGGLGDDFFLQAGEDAVSTITPGGGNNEVVVLDGVATVVDGAGNNLVMTTDSVLGSGEGVGLRLVDDDYRARAGDTVVSLGADGVFTGELTGASRVGVVVQPDTTVALGEGGFTVTGDGSRVDLTVAGTLDGRGNPVDLGSGDSVVTTTPGSALLDVDLDLGSGEDRVDLGGQVQGVRVDLGDGSDALLVRDTATGDLRLSDPEGSWMWAGDDEIQEDDTVGLFGDWDQVDPDSIGSGIVRLDENGNPVFSLAVDGDPDNVENIAILNPDGSVSEQLQAIEPDVRKRAGFLGFLGDALKIAGIVTGNPALLAGGTALDSAYQLENGADPFDVAVRAGTSIIGQGTGADWLAPLGEAAIGLRNDDPLTGILNGAVAAGNLTGTTDLTTLATTGLKTLALQQALDIGDPFAITRAGVGILDTVTGTTNDTTYAQLQAGITLADTLTNTDLTTLDGIGDLALAGTQLADTTGAFTPTQDEPGGGQVLDDASLDVLDLLFGATTTDGTTPLPDVPVSSTTDGQLYAERSEQPLLANANFTQLTDVPYQEVGDFVAQNPQAPGSRGRTFEDFSAPVPGLEDRRESPRTEVSGPLGRKAPGYYSATFVENVRLGDWLTPQSRQAVRELQKVAERFELTPAGRQRQLARTLTREQLQARIDSARRAQRENWQGRIPFLFPEQTRRLEDAVQREKEAREVLKDYDELRAEGERILDFLEVDRYLVGRTVTEVVYQVKPDGSTEIKSASSRYYNRSNDRLESGGSPTPGTTIENIDPRLQRVKVAQSMRGSLTPGLASRVTRWLRQVPGAQGIVDGLEAAGGSYGGQMDFFATIQIGPRGEIKFAPGNGHPNPWDAVEVKKLDIP
jgi:hypothetical protein